MSLTVGRISYANAIPFFFHLKRSGFTGRIIEGVPSELNALLAAGELDLSPSSSFEYALHWRDYLLLRGYSISSYGPVRSVLLFTRRPLAEVSLSEIALTGESATSVNLLKVLLREFFGAEEVVCRIPDETVEDVLAGGGSALLIGDRALRAASHLPCGMQVHDLGELWCQCTGLPFVFALWITRRAVVSERSAEIREFVRQLDRSLQEALADLEGLARETSLLTPLGAEALVSYWKDVSYQLTAEHLAGLRLFFSLCVKYRLLDELPTLDFID